jgi:hypothetical protein
MTLRRAMVSREGERETEHQIARGMRAWAIERRGLIQPRGCATTLVFGRSRSDALRRASAPGRLGEEIADDVTDAREVTSGWDDAVIWPFERAEATP